MRRRISDCISFSSISQALERTATNSTPADTVSGRVTAAMRGPTRCCQSGTAPASSIRSASPERAR